MRRALRPHSIAALILGLLLAFGAPIHLSGQQRVSIKPRPGAKSTPADASATAPDEATQNPTSRIRVDVPLVVVSVTVTDRMNRVVTGLRKRHFRLKEDKVPQEITQFGAQDTPLSVGLVFDASGSMGYKLGKAREAVAEFFRNSHRKDEFSLVQVGPRPEMAVNFTTETAEIQNELVHTKSEGRTALLDSLYLAVSNMRRASNPRKAILIISDGADNNSRYTHRELRRLVKEADVQIYAIGIFEPMGLRMRTPEEKAGPRLLSQLAEVTGGRQYPIQDISDLPDVVENIGLALRNQYVLGYVPSNQQKDGKWRRLRVEMKEIPGLPRLHTYFRLGYYAPTR